MLPAAGAAPASSGNFWRRTWAMLVKEFIQLKRDRVSFAMIIMIPLMQLLLFGYAINTNPRASADRGAAAGAERSRPLDPARAREHRLFPRHPRGRAAEAEFDRLLASGKVLFAIEIPRNFERAVRRGDRPAMLVAADATDPVAAGSALGALGQPWCRPRSRTTAPFADGRHAARSRSAPTPATIRPADTLAQHRARAGRHHPHHDHADLHRALGDARDRARHHGKPAVDADHAGRDHARQDHSLHHGRLRAGGADHRHRHRGCSACRCSAACSLLALLSTLFITTNLSIGYTFSTRGAEPAAGDADVA